MSKIIDDKPKPTLGDRAKDLVDHLWSHGLMRPSPNEVDVPKLVDGVGDSLQPLVPA